MVLSCGLGELIDLLHSSNLKDVLKGGFRRFCHLTLVAA